MKYEINFPTQIYYDNLMFAVYLPIKIYKLVENWNKNTQNLKKIK